MNRRRVVATACLLTLALAAPVVAEQEPPQPEEERVEPQRVRVQHILIGFRGSVRGKRIDRTAEEAEQLAQALLQRARSGEDFDALVAEYTDDAAPGIYAMANHGVTPRPDESRRAGMVRSFGDVSFALEVHEIGLAVYDPVASRYGWHIIKRLE